MTTMNQVSVPADMSSASRAADRPRLWTGMLCMWVAVAAVLSAGIFLDVQKQPYADTHAWVASHFATMARAYNEHGITALHGAPVQNNAPLGEHPDAYIHWPPLFPMLLSVVFSVLGESEAVARGLMLALFAANAVMLFQLTRAVASTRAALFAVIAMLAAPVMISYAFLVLHLHLAVFFCIAGVWSFVRATETERIHRGWAAFGCTAMVLAMWSSWEPALVCPGLLIAAWLGRHRGRTRLALVYGMVCAVGGASVLATYFVGQPHMLEELGQVVMYRLGVAENYNAQIGGTQRPIPRVLFIFVERLSLLAPVSLVAILGVFAMLVARGRQLFVHRAAAVVVGLLSMWAIWFVGMRNHAYIHDYQMLIAVPLACVCTGLAVDWLVNRFDVYVSDRSQTTAVFVAVFALAPALMLRPLLLQCWSQFCRRGGKHGRAVLLTPSHRSSDRQRRPPRRKVA